MTQLATDGPFLTTLQLFLVNDQGETVTIPYTCPPGHLPTAEEVRKILAEVPAVVAQQQPVRKWRLMFPAEFALEILKCEACAGPLGDTWELATIENWT